MKVRKATRIKQIPVENLVLDPLNPRLPEGIDTSDTVELVKYYRENFVTSELIESFRENGYFEQEPMIVLDTENDGKAYVVLEGNRRLASLIELLELHEVELSPAFTPLSDLQRSRLETVPCYVASSREEVAPHLGFKHIGGLKPWSPEAKARFISRELTRCVEGDRPPANPFAHVARMIGTNAQSVRLAYFAHELLKYARVELGADTSFVATNRFGVWLRCMTAKGIRDTIGIDIPRGYSEFPQQVGRTNDGPLIQLVKDLTPQTDGGTAILSDSRYVTEYGYIIANEDAEKVLRKTGDLAAAMQFVGGDALAEKIDRIVRRVESLVSEAEAMDTFEEAAAQGATRLFNRARYLKTILEDGE